MVERARRGTALALAQASHPGPSLAVTAIAVLLGISVGLDLGRLAWLGSAVLCGQVSVGLSNDWLDAARDRAVGRRDKPVALGRVEPGQARDASILMMMLGLVLAVPLGPAAALAHGVFIAAGWAYNLWLKSTPLSVVPYLVGFGTIPLIVTLARPEPVVAATWAIAAGALLGGSAHFANVLPDLEDDRAAGIRGLPHRLGRRTSGLASCLALGAAAAAILIGTGAGSVSGNGLGWVGPVIAMALAGLGVVLVVTRPPSRLPFQLVMLAALACVASLALVGAGIAA